MRHCLQLQIKFQFEIQTQIELSRLASIDYDIYETIRLTILTSIIINDNKRPKQQPQIITESSLNGYVFVCIYVCVVVCVSEFVFVCGSQMYNSIY